MEKEIDNISLSSVKFSFFPSFKDKVNLACLILVPVSLLIFATITFLYIMTMVISLMALSTLTGFIVLFPIIFFILFGIYLSVSFYFIAGKIKYKIPQLALIPLFGPLLIISKTAKMYYWPMAILSLIDLLLILTIPFIGNNFLPFLNNYFGVRIGIIFFISSILGVFSISCTGEVFKILRKSKWEPLSILIPLIGPIFFAILLGIATWSKDKPLEKI
ncbi:MAG: hypothetical protein AABW47_03890 [Nanoarchaeota archaeon]